MPSSSSARSCPRASSSDHGGGGLAYGGHRGGLHDRGGLHRRALGGWLVGLALAVAATTAPATAEAQSELPPQFAYNYGETDTARSMGMAGALRAAGGGIHGIYLNPANLGIARVYHLQAIGQWTPEAARQLYGGAIVDSTRRLSGGLSVIGGFQDPDGIDRSQIDVRMALAFAISQSVHLGVGGRYLSLNQEGLGPLGNSRASGGLLDPDDPPDGRNALENTVTFDAGATVKATDAIHISIVGQNLSYPNNALLPTTVGGGIAYATRDFTIELDGLADFNSWVSPNPRIMAGGEYLIADRVPVRLGYRFDLLSGSGLTSSHQLGVGAGYVDPSFSLEFSVRRTLVGPAATFMAAGAAFHFESLGLPIQEY